MTEQQYSAEKDLLKLIENPAEIETKKKELDAQTGAALSGKKRSFFSKRGEGQKKKLDLAGFFKDRKQILRLLFIATLCVLVYFVMTVMREYSKLKNTKN